MGKRILVADDSLTIQQAFAMVMGGSGYSLSFARSVDDAMALAKKDGRPDLVVSDVALGSGSGYDLCAEIKADETLHDVPVYILASTQSPYDEARGRKVGADGHIAKPFESQSLLDAVASALAAPVKQGSAVLPQFAADFDDNTARISAKDLPVEDDDSYGEIIIERGPASVPAPAPTQTAWSAKTPTRPSGMRPIPAAGPTAPAPAQKSPRPSLIPGVRPSAGMPAVRTGMTPPLTSSTPAPGAPRPTTSRTMMGFPSVKPPVVARPATPTAPLSQRFTPPPSFPAETPARPTGSTPVPPMPSSPALPVVSAKSTLPTHPSASPVSTASARPTVPRFSSPPAEAAAPMTSPSSSITRKVATPVPPSAPVAAPSPALANAVSSVVDQKIAAFSARGSEYEAIAKLSREIIEQVVWEVVPELAEMIIRQEIDRLASAKK
jgi:CheY-like chemotaxis protein